MFTFMDTLSILSLFAFLLLQSCMLQLSVSYSSNFTDQSALLAIKSKIEFDPKNTVLGSSNWTETTNFCDWIGVSCSRRRQRVTALNLSYMGLQGTISPHVGNLSFLTSLNLRNNSFHGFLPHEISRLHRLRILKLNCNQLEGNIPPTLHLCRELQVIRLYDNRLSGGIPQEFGKLPELQELVLSFNNLMGAIPTAFSNVSTLQILALRNTSLTGSIPSAMCNISSLTRLDLTANYLSGSLPMDLCRYWPDIQGIYFSNNNFSGQLPSKIDQCRELVSLSLSFNGFDGSIPEKIGSLQKLERIYLDRNKLIGTIPPSIGNMSSLQAFTLEENSIRGSIPSELGHLSNIWTINLDMNDLTGAIPQELFNISSLQEISLGYNALSGSLPSGTRLWHPKLESLYLGGNQLGGHIPSKFLNFSELILLDINGNVLSGPIPTSLGSLKRLQTLFLGGNQLTGETGEPELSFLTALSKLKKLYLEGNPLNGMIPDSFGNSSSFLQIFHAPDCKIKGHIPKGIGSLKNLNWLHLSGNNLTGNIPSTIGGLERLQRLYLEDNNIVGFIPKELCHLRNLGELSLKYNRIIGSIPDCIGNLNHLQILYLDSNRLTSSIPVNLWSLENLLFLNLSFNSLSGYLPQNMRKLNVIQSIDLSWNQISGNIPSVIGTFESLNSLNLSRNSFEGSIPKSFEGLKGLDFLDLSYNNLSSLIPKSLEALIHLKYLNLSFNNLSGEIPSKGPFVNFTAQSFLENKALCGRSILQVPPCKTPESRSKKNLLKIALPAAIASITILVALIYMLRNYKKRNVKIPSAADLSLTLQEHRLISYHELRQATNNFSESNLLGIGSFGSVYKGILSDMTTVAIKVLNLQVEGAFESFDAECKALRTIRHRNLARVMTTCSNPEFRALVLQYISNGTLEKWLYSQDHCLDLLQRVSIMFDVALAFEYLHHGQSEPVVHCDLKPNNVLLDENMIAHVSDFGIAKILAGNKDATQTKTLGTIGYIAPEYGSEGKVSTRGDVYSYGIMLLEIITRKKPTDIMFSEELNLRQWVHASLPDKIMEVVDDNLLRTVNEGNVVATQGILLSIMELGLQCSKEVAEERINIEDVVVKLNKIKIALLRNRNQQGA